MKRHGLLLVVVLLLGGPAGPALASWTSLGAMPEPQRDGQSLLYKNEQAVVSLTVLAPDVVRVRMSPTQSFGRDHSYAIANRQLGDPAASFEVGSERAVIRTGQLTVTVRHRPFRVAFATADGESLDEDDAARGTAFSEGSVKVWKRLRDDEYVYGLGEKTGRLNKRGRNLAGTRYTMWNNDTYAYDSGTDPIYVSVPFFMVLRNGRSHGIFLDNTHRSAFDVGHESYGRLAFGAEDGELDYYFIYGPEPKRVVQRYTDLTGRMPLPPRWALGYHQSRYSYYPESRVREIARNFRQRRIPADTLWLDIDYQEDFKPFTWDGERFPNPARLVDDLRRQGLRLVTVVDPHPAQQPGSQVYDSGLAGDHFVKNPDGTPYTGPVWPANGKKDPRLSVFPDFSKPAAREWWGSMFKMFTDIGVAGIWNDMTEPAVFRDPWHTMPLEVRHDNEGQPSDHREIHNVYGLLTSRATAEGLARLRPNERPFVLTRATFASGQRWAAIWSGDATGDWSTMRDSIPMFAGLGLSGMPFVGADVGGFTGAPTPELFTRWLQLGVFYPFLRVHVESASGNLEPWSHGPESEALNRRAIERRYELLPHIYNVMHEASETGLPAIRALMLEYPEDPRTYERDDQFLFGRDLLVAPAQRAGQRSRDVYLPKGDWFELASGKRHDGGGSRRVPLTLEDIPVFVRGGAFLFRQPVVQHTGEMIGQPLLVSVYPAARSEASLYEDDGISMDYRRGVFARRQFVQRREQDRCVIELKKIEGSYRPERDLVLEVLDVRPQRVTVGSEVLPRITLEALERGKAGWTQRPGGRVSVRLRDRPDAMTVTLAGAR
jgi:alpha-glucosidase